MEDHIFELYRRFRDQSRDEEKITTPQVSTTKTYSQNLFITICKSKKVKLMSISCEEIPETDSGLGQIFSPQNNQANTKILPTLFTNNGPLFTTKVCFQFIKDSGDMNKICDLTYKVVHSW